MANLGPLTAEIGLPVWGTQQFQGVCVLPSLLQRRRSTEAKKTLQDVCRLLGTGLVRTFRGLLPPNEILPRAKFTLPPSLAFSYISSVTAQHSSSGRQPNFAAWCKEWNYGTFTEDAIYVQLCGHCVGHRPTF